MQSPTYYRLKQLIYRVLKIQDALKIAAAQTNALSTQHQEILGQASKMVQDFSKTVNSFMETEWKPFESVLDQDPTN